MKSTIPVSLGGMVVVGLSLWLAFSPCQLPTTTVTSPASKLAETSIGVGFDWTSSRRIDHSPLKLEVSQLPLGRAVHAARIHRTTGADSKSAALAERLTSVGKGSFARIWLAKGLNLSEE
jgi:hypothetical protein